MSFYSISAVLNFLTCAILTLFVRERKPVTETAKAFSYFSGTSALWSLGYFFWQISGNEDAAVFYARFLIAAVVFIPVTYLHFVIRFTGVYEKLAMFLRVCYLLFFGFFLLDFTPLLVSGMKPGQGFKYWPEPGPYFHFFLALWIASIIYAGYLLYRKYQISVGITRSQIRYIFFGMIIGVIGGSTNFFFWYGLPVLPIGSILVSVYVALLGYAIIKYQLMDIRLFGRKMFIYFVMGMLSYGGYFIIAWIQERFLLGIFSTMSYFSGILLIPFAVFILYTFAAFLEQVINTYLFPSVSAFQKAITEFSSSLSRATDTRSIVRSLFNVLGPVFGVEKVMLLTLDEKKTRTIEEVEGFDGKVLVDDRELINYLSDNKTIFIREELALSDIKNLSAPVQRMITHLAAADVSVCVPLVSNENLVGIVLLGPKNNQDAYNKEDIAQLHSFASQVAIAVENAKLYQKISAFNETLRTTIEEQTKDLQNANAHLLMLDKQKSEFLSIASHQLRSPITAIKGYSSMLIEGEYGKLSKKSEAVVDKIFQSSQHVVGIIEDFLNISRIEQGKIVYEFAKVDIREMLALLVEEYEFRAEKKQQHIDFAMPEDEYFVKADAGKIRQIFSNLIDNAVKYTPEKGAISIRIARNKEKKTLLVSIKDTGIGISRETLSRLFQKFSRAESVRRVYTEGVGLGLYVASEMIKAHNGRVWAESEGEGKGATFFVELPEFE